jgi:putative ABC transport system permease protein
MFQFGTNEAIVGRSANGQFAGIDLGSELASGNLRLKIVGIFEANGDVNESEVWADVKVVQAAFRRGGGVSTMRVTVTDPSVIGAISERMAKDPRLDCNPFRAGFTLEQ